MTPTDLALSFRRLHESAPLVLPNAWDAGSARVVEDAGATAIATTSAGVAWAHGYSDGQALPFDRLLETIHAIVRVVGIPVSADLESGYGDGTPRAVERSVRAVLEAGAVGINLEDAPGREGAVILPPDEQAVRIEAARQAGRGAGVEVFVNARTDVYLRGLGDPAGQFEDVIRRADAYVEAGADSLFVPGLSDLKVIARLVEGVSAPVNIMIGPGAPSVADLASVGVARLSLGPSVALSALEVARRSARAVLDGRYDPLTTALSFGEADALFADA